MFESGIYTALPSAHTVVLKEHRVCFLEANVIPEHLLSEPSFPMHLRRMYSAPPNQNLFLTACAVASHVHLYIGSLNPGKSGAHHPHMAAIRNQSLFAMQWGLIMCRARRFGYRLRGLRRHARIC